MHFIAVIAIPKFLTFLALSPAPPYLEEWHPLFKGKRRVIRNASINATCNMSQRLPRLTVLLLLCRIAFHKGAGTVSSVSEGGKSATLSSTVKIEACIYAFLSWSRRCARLLVDMCKSNPLEWTNENPFPLALGAGIIQ